MLFYSRASTPRRWYELGIETLTLFAAAHPDVPIKVFGSAVGSQAYPVPVVDHGILASAELAELYRGSAAALVQSATNLSLLPLELMACGVAPVINDEIHMPAGVGGGYLAALRMPAALARLHWARGSRASGRLRRRRHMWSSFAMSLAGPCWSAAMVGVEEGETLRLSEAKRGSSRCHRA